MKKNIKLHIINFIVMLLLVLVDQLSKIWARAALGDGSSISIIPGVFRLLYFKNTGAAWGSFKNSTTALTIVSAVILIAVIVFYFLIPTATKKLRPLRIISLLVMAGAIGNMIDRIIFRFVTDFLYFELINFPIFNIADSYITVAMFAAVILLLFYYKDEDLVFLKFRKKNGDA